MVDPLEDKLAAYTLTDKDETFLIRTVRGLYRLKVPLYTTHRAVEARFLDDHDGLLGP